jgi:hypothetical protein
MFTFMLAWSLFVGAFSPYDVVRTSIISPDSIVSPDSRVK